MQAQLFRINSAVWGECYVAHRLVQPRDRVAAGHGKDVRSVIEESHQQVAGSGEKASARGFFRSVSRVARIAPLARLHSRNRKESAALCGALSPRCCVHSAVAT